MRTVDERSLPNDLSDLLSPGLAPVLLLIDVQNDFAHPDGHFGRAGADLSLIARRLVAIRDCLEQARDSGLPVIHVHQRTLPGGASDSDAWLRFKTRSGRAPDYCLPGSWGAAPVDGFEPMEGERIVEKFRPDAFLGTPLDLVLAAGGHRTVVVAGLFTEGCVESTVRTASYRDHFVVVVEDAVASAVEARHDASLDLMRARYDLCTTDALIACWSAHHERPATNAETGGPS